MPTIIPDTDAEAMVTHWTGGDLYLSVHTASPGKTGANEGTGLDRLLVATADGWNAFEADATTTGRRKTNASDLNMGVSTAAETYTHFGFWSASTGGTFRGGAELTTSKTVAVDDEVVFRAEQIHMVGAGHDQSTV